MCVGVTYEEKSVLKNTTSSWSGQSRSTRYTFNWDKIKNQNSALETGLPAPPVNNLYIRFSSLKPARQPCFLLLLYVTVVITIWIYLKQV